MSRLSSFIDLLFPPECAWCQQPTEMDRRLCDACRQQFVSDYYRCRKCAAPLPRVVPNRDCVRCRQGKWRFSTVVTLAPYRGEMRRAVIMMKKRRSEPLRRAIGDLMAEQLLNEHELPSDSDVVESEPLPRLPPVLLPIPYHWSHSFSSAANTAELLARAIAARTRWPLALRVVRRRRKTAKQGLLSWAERKANVRRAFDVYSPQSIEARKVLLIDDVMTSGATAAEVSRLLLKAGAQQVNVVVAARATGVREAPAATTISKAPALR